MTNYPRGRLSAIQLGDRKDAVVRAGADVAKKFFRGHSIKLGIMQVEVPRFKRADRLEEAGFQSTADAHDFTGRFHLRGERVVRFCEFVEGKARHLGDDVVESRLKRSRRIGKRDLVECHADSYFGRDTGDGISAGLRSQCRRAGHARIDLDQVIPERIRIQRELDIAAALDLKSADHFERTVAQHVILLVGERLRGAHNDRIPGVNADGIHVFHVADGNRSVVAVAHHLIFNFLVALHTFLDQDLTDR